MTPYYKDDYVTLFFSHCVDVMREMADNSVDAIVTDPPYGLRFMGKKWDYDVPSQEIWEQALRVLKPGGHLLAFSGTRTYHRMASAIEDAGFEIRDMIEWVYGSGFPKSLNIGKMYDKKMGNKRKMVYNPNTRDRTKHNASTILTSQNVTGWDSTKGTSPYEGLGTALKPAHEPICMARKPLSEKTVVDNVIKWGTGGIEIDECRIPTPPRLTGTRRDGDEINAHPTSFSGSNSRQLQTDYDRRVLENNQGRFPANLIHDGSDEVVGLFPQTKSGSGIKKKATGTANGIFNINKIDGEYLNGDSGSAARFFYCAKASKADRDEGCGNIEEKQTGMSNGAQLHGEGYDKGQGIGLNRVISRRNTHPTVKPTTLMRYLCRLVTPPNGTILDPFMGSGSTGKAAILEGFAFIGVDSDQESCEIAKARIIDAINRRQEVLAL